MRDSKSPLEVWTARISVLDPDVLNITRKGGCLAFAPSRSLLWSFLSIRKSGREPSDLEWSSYARSYLEEMSKSLREKRHVWEDLLGRQRVVLVCYCVNPNRCHRKLLGLILARLGATFQGELPHRF